MKHISRTLLTLLALCFALTSCARLEPPDVLDETTVSDDEHAWRYVPADDEPVHTNMSKQSAIPYYGGGFFSRLPLWACQRCTSAKPLG